MVPHYPAYEADLQVLIHRLGDAIPGPMDGLQYLSQQALNAGALSAKVKHLMALAVAIVVGCEGCIACHIRGALEAGATRQEIAETIGVAVMMGGAPSTVWGSQAFQALLQFERELGCCADQPLPTVRRSRL
jgi:AhpD family alkylhydroperoxidase